MKNTLVVVADLGLLKAFRLERTPSKNTPRLELLQEFANAEAHDKLTDKVSDSGGRNRVAGNGSATSSGERHNIQLELRKRFVRQLAESLNELLQDKAVEQCFFAASKEINHQIIDGLVRVAQGKIVKNVHADLTKSGKSQILDRFLTE